MSSTGISLRGQEKLDQEVPEGRAALFTPPPISGLGSASGFKIIIEDRGDLGLPEIQKQVERIIEASKESTRVKNLFSVFRAHTPQLYVDLDRQQCETMGLDPKEVFNTLQVYL